MPVKDCSNCENAIFDEKWGEYKCSIYNMVVPESIFDVKCSQHKPGKPKDSKANADYRFNLADSE